MNDEDTLPGIERRRSDLRISAIESKLQENTDLTIKAHERVEKLAGTVTEIKTGTDSLLEMKSLVEGHIKVMCTWAKWMKRVIYGAFGLAGVVLPVVVAAKQLGWL